MKIKRVKDKRPWGTFETFIQNKKCTVKILKVLPGKRFSLQYHSNRDEYWTFLDNSAKVIVGNKVRTMRKGDQIFVPRKTKHRIEALSKEVTILEISIGKFSEADIKRLEDDFGRI